MELPASLREINPVIDAIARGESPTNGPAIRLAVALGLATPEHSLTEAGRAYARPALAAGPASLVMSPERRAVADVLVGGPLPLQASLRRLLRQVLAVGQPLASPQALGWPEALLRPYRTYLEDLGLLVSIGPMVEVTTRGRLVAGQSAPRASWPAVTPGTPRIPREPDAGFAPFRFHLVRKVCLDLIARRGRREWHLLQPLLDVPLAPIAPAYNEWLARFLAAQPAVRRSWPPDLVCQFEAAMPAPPWFDAWCQALLGVGPGQVLDTLAANPTVLQEPPVLADWPLGRPAWLVAAAIGWSAGQGWSLRYAKAAERLVQDGVTLPPWADMRQELEGAGLMVTGPPDVRLILPVQILPHAQALWPYGGPEWLAAALLEGDAFHMAVHHGRRPVRIY